LPGTVHAEASEEIMRGLAERVSEETMEVEFRKTGFAGRMCEENSGLVFGGEEVAASTETAKGVVMEERRHIGMILKLLP